MTRSRGCCARGGGHWQDCQLGLQGSSARLTCCVCGSGTVMIDAFSGHSFPQTSDLTQSDRRMTLVLFHCASAVRRHSRACTTTSRCCRAVGRTRESLHCEGGAAPMGGDGSGDPWPKCLLVCRIWISMDLTVAVLLTVLFLRSLTKQRSLAGQVSALECVVWSWTRYCRHTHLHSRRGCHLPLRHTRQGSYVQQWAGGSGRHGTQYRRCRPRQ